MTDHKSALIQTANAIEAARADSGSTESVESIRAQLIDARAATAAAEQRVHDLLDAIRRKTDEAERKDALLARETSAREALEQRLKQLGATPANVDPAVQKTAGNTTSAAQRDRLTHLEDEASASKQLLAAQTAQLAVARANHVMAVREKEALAEELQQIRAALKQEAAGTTPAPVERANGGSAASIESRLESALQNCARLQRTVVEQEQTVQDSFAAIAKTEAVIAVKDAEIYELKGQISQVQSALAQRSLESEESFEALRQAGEAQKAERQKRHKVENTLLEAKEKIRALNADIKALQAATRRSDATHEKAMLARYRELATLMQALEKSDAKTRLLTEAHAEQGERLEAVYDEYAGLINNLIAAGTPSYLPKAMRLRRRRQILEKYDLFDRDWYVDRYPDVLASQVEPDVHFLQYGLREGRSPNRLIDALRTNGTTISA